MLILETISHETIWGGHKLMPYSDGSCSKIGHLYSLQCEANESNKILNGIYKGKTFNEYFESIKSRFGLGHYKLFPLIIALVEANDNLSIQVHPDDKAARKMENAAYGKNESWYFLETPQEGYIFNGCKGKNAIEVQRKVDDGDLETITDHLSVEKGDYVYVEAGTLHALSKGSLLYEIEENCPLTYRLYDFDRKDDNGNTRELHIDKALKAIKVDLKSVTKKYSGRSIEERRYVTNLLEDINSYTNKSDTLECITVIEGEFELDNIKVNTGMTIILEPSETIEVPIKKAMMARPK